MNQGETAGDWDLSVAYEHAGVLVRRLTEALESARTFRDRAQAAQGRGLRPDDIDVLRAESGKLDRALDAASTVSWVLPSVVAALAVVDRNGCPEGYLGIHKMSCPWSGAWTFDGEPAKVTGAGDNGVCVWTGSGDVDLDDGEQRHVHVGVHSELGRRLARPERRG